VALALMLLVSPKIVLIGYATAGVVVLASRLLVRSRRARKIVHATVRPRSPAVPAVAIDPRVDTRAYARLAA
jgi:hypothetical protein